MKIESGYDKVWKQGCRECNYLNFGCGHHEEKPSEPAEMCVYHPLKAEARIEELEEMLKWYIEEDEIHEGDPENQYWIDGKHKAMKLLGMEIGE